jgi:hypothetical protein
MSSFGDDIYQVLPDYCLVLLYTSPELLIVAQVSKLIGLVTLQGALGHSANASNSHDAGRWVERVVQ